MHWIAPTEKDADNSALESLRWVDDMLLPRLMPPQVSLKENQSMSQSLGKTIQIYLPDGNPRGVKIAEFTSRTMQVGCRTSQRSIRYGRLSFSHTTGSSSSNSKRR
jgi:hypothetical protein